MIQIIVLAAGHGKRMKSELPKVLLPLKGKPIIKYLLEAIKESGVCDKPVIVIGQGAEEVKKELGDDYSYILQKEQLGTGHAVACTKDFLKDKADNILVLYGDHPFLTAETIKKLAELHQEKNCVMTAMTAIVPDFNDWRQPFYDFGRIIRNQAGEITGIVEKKDATSEQLEIKEVNPSYFCFQANWLWQNIDKLKDDNVQGEYYLTDLLEIAINQGRQIATMQIEPQEAMGVNTAEQLAAAEKLIS